MSYIGNTPTSIAFLTDLFTGTGSLSVFTMSAAPASTSSILVSITGVVQEPSTYAVSGNTLTFSQAPPAGTGNISVRYLGIPASNIVSTAYRTVTEFTATLAQTIFTVPSYTVGYITVYRNGARLGAADYTATTGTNVVLTVAANTGDLIATESFYVSSVLNAIPAVAGAVTSSYIVPNVTLSSPSYTGTLTGSTGILNIGSGQVYKDASGNVGIGTISPGTKLQIDHPAVSTYNALQIGDFAAPANNTGIYLRTSGTAGISWSNGGSLAFFGGNVGTTERMRIDSSGNVGIGTSSPTAGVRLDVRAAACVSTLTSTSGTNSVYTQMLNSSGNFLLGTDDSAGGVTGTAYSRFVYGNGAYPMVFLTNSNERMRIDSSGNVGIGTSSPSKILHVSTSNGNGIYLEDGSSANASPIIRVRGWRSDANGSPAFGGGLVLERKGDSATANGNVLGTIYFGGNYNTTPNFGYAASISGIADGAFTSSTNTPTALTFYTGVTPNLDTNNANVFTGTERMRIDSSGNVGIGTSGPTTKLQVNYTGASASGVYIASGTAGDDTSQPIVIQKTSATVTAGVNKYVQFLTNNGATATGFIATNGTSNAGFFAGSDKRIKKDIQPLKNAFNKIEQLKPSTFAFKATEEKSEGFIAQELNEIFPQCVYKPNDGFGDELSEGQEPWAINTDKLIPYLVAAIQELKAIIDTQQEQINSLLGK